MSKKNLAKRLIALVAIMAMFAAMTVTASAAPAYNSSTVYVDSDTVKVTTYVTGLTKGDEVTYYATNGGSEVYVNQYTSAGTTLTKSYVADLEDVSNLVIKMAKVNKEFDDYSGINGIKNDIASVKFSCGEWNMPYYDGDVLPQIDDIIELERFQMTSGGKKLSSLTATIGEKVYNLNVVDQYNGNVYIVSPVAIQFGADGKYFTTDEDNVQYSSAVLDIVLDAKYEGEVTEADVAFNYIGIQTASSYTVEGATGKLFAVAYTLTNAGAAAEYGIEVDGKKLRAYGASINADNSATFAIALVDPNMKTFTYKPYAVVNDNTVYGTARKANIAE